LLCHRLRGDALGAILESLSGITCAAESSRGLAQRERFSSRTSPVVGNSVLASDVEVQWLTLEGCAHGRSPFRRGAHHVSNTFESTTRPYVWDVLGQVGFRLEKEERSESEASRNSQDEHHDGGKCQKKGNDVTPSPALPPESQTSCTLPDNSRPSGPTLR